VEKIQDKIKITHQKLREIQAPIVSSLIYGFAKDIGYEKAMRIAGNVIREDAIASWKVPSIVIFALKKNSIFSPIPMKNQKGKRS
jgi:hypothetical protein